MNPVESPAPPWSDSELARITLKRALIIFTCAMTSDSMARIVSRPYDYLSALGARIAIARNELGLSQAKMSEALGMSLRAYQSYELGKRSIPVEALVELHRKYDVDLNWILLGVEAVRMKHDLAALEAFEIALDKHLSESGTKLRSEKRGAIAARWYRSFLEGKEIAMDDVHTWIELLRE